MRVNLNGEVFNLPLDATVEKMVELLGLSNRRIAVELNQDIVPRSLYAVTEICEGDRLEVVHAIGGG
ncbi:sulfur carrier protein ThiS [Pseudomonas kurunegalensis]|uniref:sulfur carrier protein ThiS n=1 Tax=Pseudomonas kurunegalensis TaxID=485880 RepID=UPI002364414B|nr:sulfur carrier protein ThiS [Pseudomonas kurunegalensis]MDD2134541.1 sulfur carrier protein ThiS [Pseudomonas kurunegalensis]